METVKTYLSCRDGSFVVALPAQETRYAQVQVASSALHRYLTSTDPETGEPNYAKYASAPNRLCMPSAFAEIPIPTDEVRTSLVDCSGFTTISVLRDRSL